MNAAGASDLDSLPVARAADSSRRLKLPLAAVVLAVVLGVHFPAVQGGFVNYDDLSQIVGNPLVTAPGNARLSDLLFTPSHGYIVPVTLLTQASLWALGGGAAWPFHAAALGLHAGICLLVMFIVARVATLPLAFFAALLVGLHPVVVEPVAWATGIKDLLAAGFALSATALFASFAERQGGLRGLRGPGVLLLALCAMLSKPTTTLIGLAWLIFLRFQVKCGKLIPRSSWLLAGAVTLSGALLGVISRLTHDEFKAGANSSWGISLPFSVLARQAQNLVWPASLHPTYDVEPTRWFADAYPTLGLALVGLIVAGLLRARNSPRTLLPFALALVTYLPVSNVLPFSRRMSDSYLYLPFIGLVVAAAVALRAAPFGRSFRSLALVLSVPLALLGAKAHAQTQRWADNFALWQPAVRAMPTAVTPLGGLASAYGSRGDFVRATPLYEALFRRSYRPELLNDFAVSLARVGRLDDAECVMLEGTFHSTAPMDALKNFAILTGMGAARPTRRDAAALYVLDAAVYAARAGRLGLDEKSRAGLEARWNSLMQETPALARTTEPKWPLANCSVLQPQLLSTPP